MKKNSFSILELIVGLFLITILASVSFTLPSFITRNQYKRETDALQGYLQLAYDLVQHQDLDISVHFYYEGQQLIVQLSSDHKTFLAKQAQKKIFTSFKEVSLIQSNQVLHLQPQSSGKLSLTFSYYGGHISRQHLQVKGEESQITRYLLKGFPHVIQKEDHSLFTS